MDLLASSGRVEGNLSVSGEGSSIEPPVFIKHIWISYLCYLYSFIKLGSWLLGLATAREEYN